jgi:hypothetical protein
MPVLLLPLHGGAPAMASKLSLHFGVTASSLHTKDVPESPASNATCSCQPAGWSQQLQRSTVIKLSQAYPCSSSRGCNIISSGGGISVAQGSRFGVCFTLLGPVQQRVSPVYSHMIAVARRHTAIDRTLNTLHEPRKSLLASIVASDISGSRSRASYAREA